ncbi:MAG: hypothetical protein GXP62_09390 [Oligoflexia bacterium]|nr:hypothetical protein [Oligoflexia bacterium]
MTTLRKTLMALGFMSIGAVGTLGLSAIAASDNLGPVAQSTQDQGPAQRMRGGQPGPEQGLRMLGQAMSRLDLSDDQQAALDSARDDIRLKMDAARQGGDEERQQMRQQMRQTLVDGTLTRKDVKSRIQDRMDQAEDLILYTADRIFDVYETLDDDQRAQLGNMLDRFAQRRSPMRGRGGDEPGPQQGPE